MVNGFGRHINTKSACMQSCELINFIGNPITNRKRQCRRCSRRMDKGQL